MKSKTKRGEVEEKYKGTIIEDYLITIKALKKEKNSILKTIRFLEKEVLKKMKEHGIAA